MKNFVKALLIVFFTIASIKAMACASFVADGQNVRSGGSVKHFFSDLGKNRQLIVKNETNSQCRLVLEALEMMQRINGSYRYVKFSPNRTLKTSLAPYLSLVNNNGEDVLWRELVLAPNEVLPLRIGIAEDALVEGTFMAALRAFFPKHPAQLLLTELYFSNGGYSPPELILKNLSYDREKQNVSYTLKGIGNFYTFVRIDVKLVEPLTGFEVEGFQTSQGDIKPFQAYIRNYWTSSHNGARIIRANFALKDFNKEFKKQYLAKYPNTDFSKLTWIASLRVKHGVDVQAWKNHNYLALPTQLIEIKNE